MESKQKGYGRESAEGFVPGIQPPARRPLKIFPFDPSLRRTPGNLAVVDIVNESLGPGPEGRLVRVVDFDASKGVYYPPVRLDHPDILMQQGLDPSDSDPRFHQQMVYAVATKVIENFERALGRPFRFRGDTKLTILPHAFEGENAFYHPDTNSLHFGYFSADTEDPGPKIDVEIDVTFVLHAVRAVVAGGRLVALRSGLVDLEASLSCGGLPIASERRQVDLTLEVGLGSGIPLIDYVVLPETPAAGV